MNVARWLNNMQCLYNSLCDLDPSSMTNCDLALAILDLMPLDNIWWNFVSNLYIKVRNLDSQNLPITSRTFITTIHEEHWYQNKDDYQINS